MDTDRIKKIQKYIGCNLIDGEIGNETLTKLETVLGIKNTVEKPVADNFCSKTLPIAKKYLGIKEIPGSRHNPQIIEFHKTTGKFDDDETPWCSSFANYVVKEAGFEGTGNAMARSWMNWGVKLDKPVPGCIVVFTRGTGGQGHVAFVVEDQGDDLKCLGGNQSDSVCYSLYSKAKVLGYRTAK